MVQNNYPGIISEEWTGNQLQSPISVPWYQLEIQRTLSLGHPVCTSAFEQILLATMSRVLLRIRSISNELPYGIEFKSCNLVPLKPCQFDWSTSENHYLYAKGWMEYAHCYIWYLNIQSKIIVQLRTLKQLKEFTNIRLVVSVPDEYQCELTTSAKREISFQNWTSNTYSSLHSPEIILLTHLQCSTILQWVHMCDCMISTFQ